MLELFGDDRLLSPKDSDYDCVDRDDRPADQAREDDVTVTDPERNGGEN